MDLETKTEMDRLTPGASQDSFRDLKDQDIGPLMVIWSASANRKRLQDVRGKVRKAMRGKWNGVLLHLLPGETIGGMKLPQVQALYETLLRMFDPDLYAIRQAKKAEAEATARREEEAGHTETANAIADHLAEIRTAVVGSTNG